MGIKRIFTLSHNGYRPDKRLAANTHGIAVHIGGHSHSLLANDTTLPDYDLASGPYPTVVNNSKGEDTLVVQVSDRKRRLMLRLIKAFYLFDSFFRHSGLENILAILMFP